MMKILLPFTLGLFAVLQAGLNRKIAGTWGLSRAVLINGAILFSIAMVLFLLALSNRFSAIEVFHKNTLDGPFQYWFLLPGVLGFFLVLGIPWSISLIGSTTTFVTFVAAQLVASLIWDAVSDGLPITFQKVVAVVLVSSGVWLARQS